MRGKCVMKKNRDVSILVVDDEKSCRAYYVAALGMEGYHCTEAVDGVDALEKIKSNEFDLVISDGSMPNMNGPTLASRANAIAPNLPFIMISAMAGSHRTEIMSEHSNVRAIHDKPIGLDEFLSSVEKTIDSSLSE